MLVKEAIELLLKAPQDNILLADIGEPKSEEITDILVGIGTNKGFTHIKIENYED